MAKKRRKPPVLPLALTAGALLLGGFGIGLVVGRQMMPADAAPSVAQPMAAPAEPRPRARFAPPPPAMWPEVGGMAREPAPVPEPAATPAPAPVAPPSPEIASVLPKPRPAPTAPAAAPAPASRSVQSASLALPDLRPPRLPAPGGAERWRANAVAPVETGGRAMVAVVIDDMGVDRTRSAHAIALPGPLTLSFLPYAEDLPRQAGHAHRSGHELMVHVPMEPIEGIKFAGPDALLVRLGEEEIARRLARDLGRFDGFVGINNHMGSRFTAWADGMAVVMTALRERGLLWLDSRTTPTSVGMSLAQKWQVPGIERDVFLDHDPSAPAVRRRLDELEAIARRRGRAVAIGHPKDATLAALAHWLPELRRRGLVLVPLTQLVRERHLDP